MNETDEIDEIINNGLDVEDGNYILWQSIFLKKSRKLTIPAGF
jgi:hypothetical protein